MKHITFKILACALIAGIAFGIDAGAQSETAIDQTINSCLTSGAGVPTQLHYDSCLLAFDGAVAQAQKTEIHSDTRRRLYWAQAGQSAGIALLLKVSIDQAMTTESCNVSLQGMKAYSQVNPPGEPGSAFAASDTLKNFTQNCQNAGHYNAP